VSVDTTRPNLIGGAARTYLEFAIRTVCHHAFNFAFKAATPYIVVLADMDAGVRVNAPLHGVSEADLRIGLPVRLSFEAATPEITLPCLVAA